MERWGLSCSVDVFECDPQIITSAEKIKTFAIALCELIGMKRFGDCQVVSFSDDEKKAGFSMTQLIESSLISGHFANSSSAAYIDVFSCKAFDPDIVARFTVEYFQGKSFVLSYKYR